MSCQVLLTGLSLSTPYLFSFLYERSSFFLFTKPWDYSRTHHSLAKNSLFFSKLPSHLYAHNVKTFLGHEMTIFLFTKISFSLRPQCVWKRLTTIQSKLFSKYFLDICDKRKFWKRSTFLRQKYIKVTNNCTTACLKNAWTWPGIKDASTVKITSWPTELNQVLNRKKGMGSIGQDRIFMLLAASIKSLYCML